MREDVSLQRLTEKVMMRHTGVRNGEIEKATANKENNKNSNSNKRYSDEQHPCLSLSLIWGKVGRNIQYDDNDKTAGGLYTSTPPKERQSLLNTHNQQQQVKSLSKVHIHDFRNREVMCSLPL